MYVDVSVMYIDANVRDVKVARKKYTGSVEIE